MANRQMEKIWGLGKGYVVVAGSFAPNTAGTINAASNKGKGFSVAYGGGTGLFTLTFTDKYSDLISITVTSQLASAAASHMNAGTYDASARTIVLRNYTAGSLANIAADANNRVNFIAVFRNSSVTSGTSA